MSYIGEMLIYLVYLWLIINVILIMIRIIKAFSKDKLTKERQKALKLTIKYNFVYAAIALIVGFVLL